MLDEISFRVGGGATAALVGPNGTGKTTLLRIVAGDLDAHGGTVTSGGGVGVMRQFIGHGRRKARHGVAGYDDVGGLLLSVAPPRIRPAASALEALLRGPDEVLLLDEPDNFLDVPAASPGAAEQVEGSFRATTRRTDRARRDSSMAQRRRRPGPVHFLRLEFPTWPRKGERWP